MKRLWLVAALAALLPALNAATAQAQAIRTWVSGVGDDVNPCSRTAPCKTFAGAIPKTATNGEINCIDSASYGQVTITKTIAIVCDHVTAGVTASSGNAIAISAGRVILRGLSLNGLGSGANGVVVSGTASLSLENSSIRGFTGAGLQYSATGALVVADSAISNNASGVVVDGSSGAATLTLREAAITGNSGSGVIVTSASFRAQAMIERSLIAQNGGTGVLVGGPAAVAMLGSSTVTGNATGVSAPSGALYTFKTNQIGGNGSDGAPLPVYPGLNAPAGAHDLGGDGASDILWRRVAGDLFLWRMIPGALPAGVGMGSVDSYWAAVGQRDFDGDGKADLLWRGLGGELVMWLMDGEVVRQVGWLGVVPTAWSVVATGDFNGDGRGDILWRTSVGELAMWTMNGVTATSVTAMGNIGPEWRILGAGDFNGDARTDVFWRSDSGQTAVWLMNGATVTQISVLGSVASSWQVAASGDYDGDGTSDLLWRDGTGAMAMWLMTGGVLKQLAVLGSVSLDWTIAGSGDFDADGRSDILWRQSSGEVAIWNMNGAVAEAVAYYGAVPTDWAIQTANAQ